MEIARTVGAQAGAERQRPGMGGGVPQTREAPGGHLLLWKPAPCEMSPGIEIFDLTSVKVTGIKALV